MREAGNKNNSKEPGKTEEIPVIGPSLIPCVQPSLIPLPGSNSTGGDSRREECPAYSEPLPADRPAEIEENNIG